MHSLLVFLHLAIAVRLSDGAPVPTPPTLDCILNNPNLPELEHCVAAVLPSDTTSQLSNGGAPAIGRNGVSELASSVTSAADKDSLARPSSGTISAASQGDLSGFSNVATTAADEEGVAELLPEGDSFENLLLLFGVHPVGNKIASSGSDGGAGDSGSGGLGGSGGSGTTEGAADENGDPQAYAGTRYGNANGNTSASTGEPGYPSASTDSRDGDRLASNDGLSSNTSNGSGFHTPPYPDQRTPDTPGAGSDQSGAGAPYARYPSTLNPGGDAYVGYSSAPNTVGGPDSGYPSTSSGTGDSYVGYPSTSKPTGERNPTSGYPDAFANSAPPDYSDSDPNTDRYLGSTGGGRGGSQGEDDNFGPLSRIASHQGDSCEDKAACTNIGVESNDGGKVKTSPAVVWTSEVVPDKKTPEIKEVKSGCPDGDVNACVDT